MKLDRNINGDGHGKYGLIKNRKLIAAKDVHSPQGLTEIEHAVKVLETAGILDWGGVGAESEFFVIKLRDAYAKEAIWAYAEEADRVGDTEYASEIREMANRAGPDSLFCKKPD